MPHPFELSPDDLAARLEEMVDVTFADLQSQFLVLPRGSGLVEYPDFQAAYEVLKHHTAAFATLDEMTIWRALERNSLAFVVLRTILGLSPPEWAELARTERDVDVPQNFARKLDTDVRRDPKYFERLRRGGSVTLGLSRAKALVSVAVEYISAGAPSTAPETIHRLAKVDTQNGLRSLQHVAASHIPYAVLLYERYLGRPFASHRDSVSELVGDVMETAVEERLAAARITFRKTKRAEQVPGFPQAPDFFVPTEFAPAVIIEAKITSDDGTARDKVTRILRLATMRDERLAADQPAFEVVACVDGRGFGIRRNDMKQMLTATRGKVFTLATLDKLITCTSLRSFVPAEPTPRNI